MDKIKTIIIEENQLIQDSGTTPLTDQYIELIPKDTVARYLKLNFTFKNWIPKLSNVTTTIDNNTEIQSDATTEENTITDTTNEATGETINETTDTTSNTTIENVDTPPIDGIVNNTRYPFIKINGELCPIMTQHDFEIKSEDRFQIESLMVNNTVGLGSISMILVSYGKKL
ncbi:hypothetical protein [Clostridium beijerinckii]|uniref:Uncharacterized protein n=1 Tax=Clostridium beijerinckii TaxID=1520 RepID=A0AAX0B8I6_CLOBE|nr:hypothetical protein [Clostridium beijerinckii]NRT91504.1 hypothetical protein [Clostridium beijerinckii]NYC71029.1 hypothetical protein [Clostridium beijerinckii]